MAKNVPKKVFLPPTNANCYFWPFGARNETGDKIFYFRKKNNEKQEFMIKWANGS